MKAIEITHGKCWLNFWLKCDSMLVVLAFNNSHLVPWQLTNRWINFLYLTSLMDFCISHIFKEDNTYANKLVAFGVHSSAFCWWDILPPFIVEDLRLNRSNIPSVLTKL